MFANSVETETEKIMEANQVFRSLVTLHSHIGLLCDVYSSPMFSNARISASIVETFASSKGECVLDIIAHLYR